MQKFDHKRCKNFLSLKNILIFVRKTHHIYIFMISANFVINTTWHSIYFNSTCKQMIKFFLPRYSSKGWTHVTLVFFFQHCTCPSFCWICLCINLEYIANWVEVNVDGCNKTSQFYFSMAFLLDSHYLFSNLPNKNANVTLLQNLLMEFLSPT